MQAQAAWGPFPQSQPGPPYGQQGQGQGQQGGQQGQGQHGQGQGQGQQGHQVGYPGGEVGHMQALTPPGAIWVAMGPAPAAPQGGRDSLAGVLSELSSSLQPTQVHQGQGQAAQGQWQGKQRQQPPAGPGQAAQGQWQGQQDQGQQGQGQAAGAQRLQSSLHSSPPRQHPQPQQGGSSPRGQGVGGDPLQQHLNGGAVLSGVQVRMNNVQ